ncbi:MAG: pro-sigmaK processing inhibitor BofA family protein [Clostridia bacterium]|nr:pro-sigmaK processing inhibitor BofA family protein [Clostridia bacterium]
MENYSFFVYIFCIIFMIIIGRASISPVKKIIKIVINSIIGALVIFVINAVGNSFNFHIGLNWATILTTGVLGIPGFILVIVLKVFI